jgi:hypothetical protein
MKKLLIITLYVFGFGTAFSQITKPDIMTTSGDYYKSTNTSLSWTIGECVNETFVSQYNMLSQGFQQGGYVLSPVTEISSGTFKIMAFPNPVNDCLFIVIENQSKGCTYSLKLFDMKGKVLVYKNENSDNTSLDLGQYANGVYFLNIVDSKTKIPQIFKILKND